MTIQDNADDARWSSRTAFILAAIGSSVGLGNLWRFPYVAGENGGGAFVILYVLCVLLIGLPVLAAELFIGRRGRRSAVGSVVVLAKAEGRSSWWALQSWLGMIGSFIILTYYSVIAGWVIAYIVMIGGDLVQTFAAKGAAGLGAGAFAGESQDAVNSKLIDLLNDPSRMIFYHAAFMALTVFIVARGVKGGIEKVTSLLMPAFFVMLLILVGFALVTGDRGRGLDFLLGVRLGGEQGLLHGLADGSVISAALGQAFFSIGLGSALMMTYGAYMEKDQDIPRSSRFIVLSDTGVGILAGMAIFPIVFQVGLNPGQGPTLMFQTLPLAFQQMPAGGLFGLIFFILALFAAITSSIALLEASTRWFEDQQKGRQRTLIAILLGVVAFAVGVANALSQVPTVGPDGAEQTGFFNTWRPLDGVPQFSGLVLLDFLSRLTDYILPIAGFITAVFAGWVVSASTAREELGFKSELWFRRWRFLIRYICPIGIGAVIFYSIIVAPLLGG